VLPAAAEAVPPVQLLQCNSDETSALTQCQKPVNAIGDRLAQMFQVRVLVVNYRPSAYVQGGFQAFLASMDKLAGVFVDGCDAADQFKRCAQPVIKSGSSCHAISCLIIAGNGICNETNRQEAINKNLGCVFGLITQEGFNRCLRDKLLRPMNVSCLLNLHTHACKHS
jgi:hypothetical protein